MVVEVLVAQRQCHHPLADQTLYRVFHQLRVPIVAKAGRELTQQTRPLFDLAQQEPTAVRAQLPTVKSGHNLTLSNPLETQLFNATLCLFHAAASPVYQVVADTQLNSTVRRLFLTHGEKCGPKLYSATSIVIHVIDPARNNLSNGVQAGDECP